MADCRSWSSSAANKSFKFISMCAQEIKRASTCLRPLCFVLLQQHVECKATRENEEEEQGKHNDVHEMLGTPVVLPDAVWLIPETLVQVMKERDRISRVLLKLFLGYSLIVFYTCSSWPFGFSCSMARLELPSVGPWAKPRRRHGLSATH